MLLMGMIAGGAAATAGYSAKQQGEAQARTLKKIGAEAQRERDREAKSLLARQRVAYAKAGVDLGSGTPLDVQTETAGREWLAGMRIRAAYRAAAAEAKRRGHQAELEGLVAGGLGGGMMGGANSGSISQLGAGVRTSAGTGYGGLSGAGDVSKGSLSSAGRLA
jgi:hypothetical protein